MRTTRALLVLFCACTAAAAADREFTAVVRAISDEFNTRPMKIPMFGLVNVVTFFARPYGTKHIDLAIFEHLDENSRSGSDLSQTIKSAVRDPWKPFVQVRSSKSGRDEMTFVYLRPHKDDWKMLITALSRDEATVVQLQLNADAMERWMKNPAGRAMNWREKEGRGRDWDPDDDKD